MHLSLSLSLSEHTDTRDFGLKEFVVASGFSKTDEPCLSAVGDSETNSPSHLLASIHGCEDKKFLPFSQFLGSESHFCPLCISFRQSSRHVTPQIITGLYVLARKEKRGTERERDGQLENVVLGSEVLPNDVSVIPMLAHVIINEGIPVAASLSNDSPCDVIRVHGFPKLLDQHVTLPSHFIHLGL